MSQEALKFKYLKQEEGKISKKEWELGPGRPGFECHLCNLLASDFGSTLPQFPHLYNGDNAEMRCKSLQPASVLRLNLRAGTPPSPKGVSTNLLPHGCAFFVTVPRSEAWLPEMVTGRFRKALRECQES